MFAFLLSSAQVLDWELAKEQIIPNPDLAWQAFQDAMLVDLKFESR